MFKIVKWHYILMTLKPHVWISCDTFSTFIPKIWKMNQNLLKFCNCWIYSSNALEINVKKLTLIIIFHHLWWTKRIVEMTSVAKLLTKYKAGKILKRFWTSLLITTDQYCIYKLDVRRTMIYTVTIELVKKKATYFILTV